MIKSLDQSLWQHITIHSTPLLPPSFDLGSEFALRDVHVTAQVAVDIRPSKITQDKGLGKGEDRRLCLYI